MAARRSADNAEVVETASNVVPFRRPDQDGSWPETADLVASRGDAAQAAAAGDGVRLAVLATVSLAVHVGVFAALWRQPTPLASIGIEVMSVELVIGAAAPAGIAAAPGESHLSSAANAIRPDPPVEQAPDVIEPPRDMTASISGQTRESSPSEQPPDAARSETDSPAQAERTPDSPQERSAEAKPEQTPHVADAEAQPSQPVDDTAPKQAEKTPDLASQPTRMTALPLPDSPRPAVKPDPPHAEPQKPAAKPEPKSERRPSAAPKQPGKQANASAASAANNVGVGRSDRDTNYAGVVAAHLRRHQQYPSDARGRGQQGTAAVGFSLDGGGRVTSARLVRSSGVPSIDQEVQAMVRRASPFPPPPSGRALSVTVPVTFRLN